MKYAEEPAARGADRLPIASKDDPWIVDNYGTHKHPRVRKWLVQHPRWTFHFTPTSASWFNAIERPR
jgi:hypothetical protein